MPLESIIAPVTGFVLVVLGLAFLRRHRRVRQARRLDPGLTADEKSFYDRQYRRRMLTSGLIVVLGILIPLGDFLLERKPALPALAMTLYWIGVLLIVLFVLLLGVIDLFVTGLQAKEAINRVRSEKAALERELEEVRRSLRDRGC